MHTNDPTRRDNNFADISSEPVDTDHPGYETEDVNVNGIAVFLAGLFGFVLVFFVFCYGMGQVINSAIARQDGATNKWHQVPGSKPDGRREDMTSNAELEQRELHRTTSIFPTPRLDIDDGNQAVADLHAREDLLLQHYSSDPSDGGRIRIPIERAMALIAENGLPVAPQETTAPLMAGDTKPTIQTPLTNGFARTGYELQAIEARNQRLSYSNAEEATHAAVIPMK